MRGQSQVLGALARLWEAPACFPGSHSHRSSFRLHCLLIRLHYSLIRLLCTARFIALTYLLACSLAPELVGQWNISFQLPPLPPPNLVPPSPASPSSTPSLPRLLFPSDSEIKNMRFRGFEKTVYGWTGGRTDGPTDKLMDGWTYRQTDGPTD